MDLERPFDIMTQHNKFLLKLLLCLPAVCSGAAFQHFQQSTASIALNHADMSALADEPSIAYYNPAGMVLLKNGGGFQFGFASSNIRSDFNGSVKITDDTDTAIYPAVYSILGDENIGVPDVTMPPSSDQANIVIPSASSIASPVVGFFHGAKTISLSNDLDLAIGLSVTSPWGLETDWRSCKIWSYAGQTCFHSIAVTPSLAVRFRNFCLGAGFSWQEFRFDAYNYLYGSCANFKLYDSKFTWDVGGIYQIDPYTRLGFVYRPSVSYNLKGRSDFGNYSSPAKSHMTLPQSFTFGAYRKINHQFELMATAVYTTWSQFKEIDITTDLPDFSRSFVSSFALFNTAGQATFHPSSFNFPIKFSDSFFVALGGIYTVDQWKLRGGVGYDGDPYKKYSDALIPDSTRYSASFGFAYRFNSYLNIDFGYQFILIPKSELKSPILSFDEDYNTEQTTTPPNFTVDNFNQKAEFAGSVKSWAQVISLQLRCNF